jgi:hypothetical protein
VTEKLENTLISEFHFQRYIGIDYSGAKTPLSPVKGLRVFTADAEHAPQEVVPENGKHWCRRGVAEWLVDQVRNGPRTVIGIDHAFSFPEEYFAKYGIIREWPAFLDDFCAHWPTDHVSVKDIRDEHHGNGAARSGKSTWKRCADNCAPGAKSVFHFDIPGCVATSTHAGLPWLRDLRQQLGPQLHCWPFDGWDIPPGQSVLAEVYPSLWRKRFPNEKRTPDQHDAYAVSAWLKLADSTSDFAHYFRPALTEQEQARAPYEGWILGVV